MRKLKVTCPYCDKVVLKVSSCKDLTLDCECGEEFLVNATEESAVIKIRAPDEQKRNGKKLSEAKN